MGVAKYVTELIFGISFLNLLCLLPNTQGLFSDS